MDCYTEEISQLDKRIEIINLENKNLRNQLYVLEQLEEQFSDNYLKYCTFEKDLCSITGKIGDKVEYVDNFSENVEHSINGMRFVNQYIKLTHLYDDLSKKVVDLKKLLENKSINEFKNLEKNNNQNLNEHLEEERQKHRDLLLKAEKKDKKSLKQYQLAKTLYCSAVSSNIAFEQKVLNQIESSLANLSRIDT